MTQPIPCRDQDCKCRLGEPAPSETDVARLQFSSSSGVSIGIVVHNSCPVHRELLPLIRQGAVLGFSFSYQDQTATAVLLPSFGSKLTVETWHETR